MKTEDIASRLVEAVPFENAKTSTLFELAAELRLVATPTWPERERAMAGEMCRELARRSSGQLKALGLLADLGDRAAMAEILLGEASWTYRHLRCAGAFFRLSRRASPQRWCHLIANEAGCDRAFVDTETVAAAKHRITGAADFDHDIEPAWNAPVCENLEWPVEPIVIPALAGVRVRPLRSRQQVDRATNYLHNCLGSLYRAAILDGTKRVATVEIDGAPVECLEIDRRSGRVLSWKGARNNAPDAIRRRIIEKHLVDLRVIAGGQK